jgi:cold shock protein
LAELKLLNKQAEEAYRIACRATLAFGEDKAKVSLFALVGQIAFETRRLDVAIRHAALARLVRVRQGWSVPGEVTQLESKSRLACEQAGQPSFELPDDISKLTALCKRDWEQAVPPELKPQPKEKRPRRLMLKPDGAIHTGRVKTYKEERGFGFIKPDDGTSDIFFHISNVQDIELPVEGMAVQYQIAESQKGLNAVNVQPAREQ